jgi:hypothetical protein
MTKLSLCIAFTIALLVGMNSIPAMVYAQTDEEAAQPSVAAQSDQTATPSESAQPNEQGDDAQNKATEEPENQGDEQSPQDQE